MKSSSGAVRVSRSKLVASQFSLLENSIHTLGDSTMVRQFLYTSLCITILALLPSESMGRGGGGARGGGGGGFGGGASRGGGGFGGGGGFSGGGMHSPSGFGDGGGFSSSAGRGPSGFSGGAAGFGEGAHPGAGVGVGGAAGFGGGARPGAGVGVGGAAGFGGGARAGGQGAGGYAAPNRSQLDSFLGMPSGQGASNLSSRAGASQLPAAGGNFDVNKGTAEGPRGGQAAGITVTGPGGNTAGKAVGVGAQGGVAAVGGVQGAAGGTAARGAAVGPGGQVVAGRGAVGPGGYGGGGVVTAGPAGVGAGFTRATPAGRYTAATGVRGNYNNWGVYNRGWYAQYPGAWFAAGWTANALWNTATWGTASSYCGYSEQPPVYYDYGTSVVYEDSNVYVNGDNAGTAEQYSEQAASIAAAGAQAEAPADGDWLPLGVFAFTRTENPKSDITIQLAISKDGIIRGNYTDTATNQNQVVQGSVDKQTQRVAFTVGDNKTSTIETGLYNLTKDEAPCLIHIGKDKTEQWLLIRLENPDTSKNAAS